MKNIKLGLLIYLMIFAIFGISNVKAVTISNPNGNDVIPGYTSSNVNSYIGLSTGVVQATGNNQNFYCLEPGLPHPLQMAEYMWNGTADCTATTMVYENSDSNYAACAVDATTGYGSSTFGNIQLHLWQALAKNVSLSSYCNTNYDYALTVYTCVPNNNTYLTGTIQKLGVFTKTLKEQTATIRIEKVCESGVTGNFSFTAYNTQNSYSTVVSCNSGKNLTVPIGTYTIREDNVPSNVVVSPSVVQTITVAANDNKTITFTNSKVSGIETGNLTIIKTDSVTNAALQGVIFKLLKVDGNVESDATYASNNQVIGNKTTDATGKIYIEDLTYGTYKLIEVSNPSANYIVMEPITFTINSSAQNKIIEVKNNPIRIKINKTNLDGTVNLDNAVFLITDKKTGSTIRRVTITSTDNYISFEPGEYTITEITAPTGYELLDISFSIKVNSDGTATIINGVNEYINLVKENNENILNIKNDIKKITITKKDLNTNKVLSGAQIKITTKEGIEIATWISTETAYRIILEPGEYILTEISSPNKYEANKTVLNFVVDVDGNISTNDKESIYYEIDNNKIIVYNVKPTSIPDTGIGLKIGLVVVGSLLIGLGVYFIVKNKNKNI